MTKLRACLLFALSAALTVGPIRDAGAAEGKLAARILKSPHNEGGLCVHLGVTDGRLTAALSGGGRFVVHGLTDDDASVERAREYIQSKGVYGPVSVERSALERLPYAENLVNLVVAEDLPVLLGKGLALKEILRVLAPYGALCFGGRVDSGALEVAGFKETRASGAWTAAIKPWPAGMDGWPIFDHGNDGNPVSKDLLVGPATSLRWRTGPTWGFHGGSIVLGWVTANGRMFHRLREKVGDGHRVRDVLAARDAYNGFLLWRRPVEAWRNNYGDRNVVATKDRLYTPLGPKGPYVALDAATGKIVRTYSEAGNPTYVLLHDDALFMSTWRDSWAVDIKTGKRLWHNSQIGSQFVIAGNQLLFGSAYPGKLASLDPATGAVRWQTDGGGTNRFNAPLYYGGALILVKNAPREANKYRLYLEGLSPKDGQPLWTFRPKHIYRKGGCYAGEVFGAQGLVWVHADVEPNPEKNNAGKRPSAWLALDPATGDVKRRFDDATSDPAVAKMLANGIHRCNRGTATERFFLYGTYEFFEWANGTYHVSNITRSACGVNAGMLPANGLVYTPPFTCVCRTFMARGFLALAYRPRSIKEPGGPRLEKGPAFGAALDAPSAEDSDGWPMYRHDLARLGATASAVPADVKPLWQTAVGGMPTAPTVAGGRVFVASMDDYRVTALDATTGEIRWRFTAGGCVDSPPTVHGGAVVFGCRDGWIYCLRADDGTLVWRFRAAPAEERIVVDRRLESAWPAHGSVLVLYGTVYCAVGRHMGLDGGVTLYALGLTDGRIVWTKRLEKLPGDHRLLNRPVDLLTSNGTHVFMRRSAFDPKTGERTDRRDRDRIMAFGVSGFLDNKWFEYDNTKGRLRWSDGRASGDLLASSRGITCGISATVRGNAPRAGMGDFHLFGKKDRSDKGWTVQAPVQMRAILMAGNVVFVAGRPDERIRELDGVTDRKRIAAVVATLPEDRLLPKTGRLLAFSSADGKQLSALSVDAPPVFDGLAAAAGRLYLSCKDGTLRCFGKE